MQYLAVKQIKTGVQILNNKKKRFPIWCIIGLAAMILLNSTLCPDRKEDKSCRSFHQQVKLHCEHENDGAHCDICFVPDNSLTSHGHKILTSKSLTGAIHRNPRQFPKTHLFGYAPLNSYRGNTTYTPSNLAILATVFLLL